MDFQESTQRRNWTFTTNQLKQQREANRQRILDAIQQQAQQAHSASVASLDTLGSEASAGAAAAPALSLDAPTLGEELLLLKFYATRLQHVSRELKLPRRVQGSALAYLSRLYLTYSCLEHDPQQLLLTCLYLACKIEEHYISAAELGRLTGVPAEVILRTELTALQGLKFDLIVHSPYKAIEGFLDDIREAIAAAAAAAAAGAAGAGDSSGSVSTADQLDVGLAALSEEQLGKARAAAYAAADALLLSDAPLLHTPGRLALAALRSGFSKLGVKLHRYVERVALKSSSPGGDGSLAVEVRRLQAALAELDQLGREGAAPVDAEQVKAIDGKLKACRSQLVDASGQAAVRAKAKADKAARKAARAAEQRRAAEAAVGIMPAEPAVAAGAAGGEPPAKRARPSD